MQLEEDRRARHEGGVRLQGPELAEPDRDPLAVVVGADRRVHHGGEHPEDDHEGEHEVHRLVHHRRRPEHPPVGAASVDEEEESAHAGDRRGEPDRDRHEVVHVVGQADGAGPRFRDSEPDRVPEEDPDDPVVEHRRADP